MRINLYFPAVTPIPVRQVHLSGNAGVTLLPRNATLVWSCGTGLQAQGRGRSGTPAVTTEGICRCDTAANSVQFPFGLGKFTGSCSPGAAVPQLESTVRNSIPEFGIHGANDAQPMSHGVITQL